MTYFEHSVKVLSAIQNDPRLFNKELLKSLYWMQRNNEDIEQLIKWVEQSNHKK